MVTDNRDKDRPIFSGNRRLSDGGTWTGALGLVYPGLGTADFYAYLAVEYPGIGRKLELAANRRERRNKRKRDARRYK